MWFTREGCEGVRTFMIPYLMAVLTLCPVFCGTESDDHRACFPDAVGTGSDEAPSTPAHCPEEGDDCICQGAILPVAVKVAGCSAFALNLPSLLFVDTSPHTTAHSPWEVAPTGFAGKSDSLTVRAFLQNFRC